MMEELRAQIRKYALQNAVKYGKSPKKDVVLKRMLSEQPELRQDAKSLSIVVKEEIKRIDSMSKDERAEELAAIAPELLDELSAAEKEPKRAQTGLPELPLAEGENVVMRFAPNPNGAATLGSARGIIINSEYARRYKGKFILRFDDTDPVLKRPLLAAYNWYLEDCAWLDAEPDEVVVASDRIDLYYTYAKELIKKEAAYVCFCPAETFKRYKDNKQPCPHRTASVEETLENWEKMLGGVYKEKEAVLRIKTDIASPDPALRDWVAFRVLKRDHPRPQVGEKYVVWPMLDFESAIEDHLLGLTHIIRGKDLMKSEQRQRFLYDYFGWEYPRTMLWGKIKIHEFGKFSTSELGKAIERGDYEGWDDPQLPTLRALRRRGFRPEAIRKFFIAMGVTRNDIAVSMKNLYAENRKLVDKVAERHFFVRDPVKLRLLGEDNLEGEAKIYSFDKLPKELQGVNGKTFKREAPKHASHVHQFKQPTGNLIYISTEDSDKLKNGQKIRLKYLRLVNIESIEPLVAQVIKKDKNTEDVMPVIQWAPTDSIKIVVKRPDGIDEGICTSKIVTELGNVVQFERYGFVRIDSVNDPKTEVVAYFTH
jgi:glutamyl-tRNA synthetase